MLILIFIGSIVLGLLSFMSSSAFLFGVSVILQSLMSGALHLYMYEFMTEIIFPVSPCFALAILNSLSGLASLFITMFSDDIVYNDPLNTVFPKIVKLISLSLCIISLYFFYTAPYKLNRSDYDFNRRSTMVTIYMSKNKNKKPSATSINDQESNADAIN